MEIEEWFSKYALMKQVQCPLAILTNVGNITTSYFLYSRHMEIIIMEIDIFKWNDTYPVNIISEIVLLIRVLLNYLFPFSKLELLTQCPASNDEHLQS